MIKAITQLLRQDRDRDAMQKFLDAQIEYVMAAVEVIHHVDDHAAHRLMYNIKHLVDDDSTFDTVCDTSQMVVDELRKIAPHLGGTPPQT